MVEKLKQEWRLGREVGVSTIIASVVFFMAAVAAWYANSERVSNLEFQYGEMSARVVSLLERQIQTDKTQDNSLLLFRAEIREDVGEQNKKLDRITELVLTLSREKDR